MKPHMIIARIVRLSLLASFVFLAFVHYAWAAPLEFSMLHTTLSGSQVTQIVIIPHGQIMDSAVISGPNDFSYSVQGSDAFGDAYLIAYPTTLEEGLYTLTFTDSVTGDVINRVDSYTGLMATPLVKVNSVRYFRNANDTYTFHWPQVKAAKSYFYRLWIFDAGGLVYLSDLTQGNSLNVGSLPNSDPDAYVYMIATSDREVYDLAFNASRTSPVTFTANEGNVAGLLPSPFFYNRYEADGSHKIMTGFSLPDDIANVSLAEVSGPGGFYYRYDLSADFDAFDYTLFRKFSAGNAAAPSKTGIYTFHAIINDLDYYSDATLTPAVKYPAPKKKTWQVENLNNGSVRLSWADVKYNGLLYYRVMFLNGNNNYYITPRKNTTSAVVNMQDLVSKLGSGPLRWRVEIHDSSNFQTLRNRRNGKLISFSEPAYDPFKPYLNGRFNNRNFANGEQVLQHFANVADFSQVASLDVTGPDSYALNLKLDDNEYVGFDYRGYYSRTKKNSAKPGLYTYHLVDTEGSEATFYDTLTAPVALPVVDYRTIHLDQLASGNQLLSWAPVFHSSPLWYNLLIRSLEDHNQDGQADEIFVLWNQSSPYVEIPAGALPDEPLIITIQARDASTGSLENNRSVSVTVGYEAPGFDFSALDDDDMDGWASNVDNCPNVKSGNLANNYGNDAEGDVCDDTDGDGVVDALDYDPLDPNVGQSLELQSATAETFESGEVVLLQWQAVEGAVSYVLKYTLNNGATWKGMGSSVSAEKEWTVPLVEKTKRKCMIKLTAKDQTGAKLGRDKSVVTFTIKPPQPMALLTELNASYSSGATISLDWFAPMAAATMNIKLTANGGVSWMNLATVDAADEQWTDSLPFVIKDASGCQLKLTTKAEDGTKLSAAKSDLFTLIAPFSLTSPVGGEEWEGGTQQSITWSLGNLPQVEVAKVKMVYTTNGGNTWKPLITLIGSDALVTDYTWTLPVVGKDKANTKIKIKLKDADGKTLGKEVSGLLTLLAGVPE